MRSFFLATATALVVLPAAFARADSALDLVGPISDYKIYVSDQMDVLVKSTDAFVAAIKAGDLAKAKTLYAPTRFTYETIEPVAELFADLDKAIDSRADDHEKAEADPAFTGFHRLEYGLWGTDSAETLAPIADHLLADVKDLQARVEGLTFPPEIVVGGAAALMEEVAISKISGEEDRYSHTDLWDFKANVDGAQKIVGLVRPLIATQQPDFLVKVDANFATIDAVLKTYEQDNGYVTYDKLTDKDRVALSAAVNVLAEDLNTLRGKLGLD